MHKQFFFTCPNTSFTAHCFNLYINNIICFKYAIFYSYLYTRSADILWALSIVIYSIIEIITFFYCPNTCFAQLCVSDAFEYISDVFLYITEDFIFLKFVNFHYFFGITNTSQWRDWKDVNLFVFEICEVLIVQFRLKSSKYQPNSIKPLPPAITSGGNFVRAMLNCCFPATAA